MVGHIELGHFVGSLLCAGYLGFAYPHSAFGQEADAEADAIVSFGDWSVFKDDVACWAASSAEEINSDSDGINEEDVAMYVSFFRKQPVPEISFFLGGHVEDNMTAEVSEVRADFFSNQYGVYFAAESERDLIFALLDSRQLALSPASSSKPMATFSLEGFREAYNSLARICEFKHVDFTDGDVTWL